MKLKIEKPVTIITPTIGNAKLEQCIRSVNQQSYKNIRHLLVIDGPQHYRKVMDIFDKLNETGETSYIQFSTLAENVGEGGYYGHRIYAAFPHLVNTDYVAFLDEDNWIDENHIESLINTIEEKDLSWAHSLRKVYIEDEYLADDCCEAIGRWPVAWSDGSLHLVDTSTYCFKRDLLINISYIWHHGWGGDRRFFMAIKDHPEIPYDTTGLHTLNYRLPDIDKAYDGDREIFKRYNEIMKQQHNGAYPWQK